MNKYNASLIAIILSISGANAFEYTRGKSVLKLNGYGTIGTIAPHFETPVYINDWRARAMFDYNIDSWRKIGAVYAIDELAIYQDQWARDAFVFAENNNLGRIEVGFTDSVATKLSVGLPDVSGLRINDNPIFYKKIAQDGTIISNTAVYSGRYNGRINIVSAPINSVQYGASIAAFSDNYNLATDAAIKYRASSGKTKTALSLSASYIDAPKNFIADAFAQNLTADFRAQLSAGLNIQYNSWIWGLSARAIYDENAIGRAHDGISTGTGISYDLLQYTISASYLMSNTGIWSDSPDYITHTGILSFRYKYSENIDAWMGLGITSETPFFSTGLRATF